MSHRGPAHAARRRSSRCSPRRTRSSPRAPTRCPRRSSTASCSRSTCGYPRAEEEDAILASRAPRLRLGRPARARACSAAVTQDRLLAARARAQRGDRRAAGARLRPQAGGARRAPRRGIRLGAGPRAGVHLLLAAKALAALRGRGFVTPDDVRYLAGPVLKHRLLLSPDAELDGATARGRAARGGAVASRSPGDSHRSASGRSPCAARAADDGARASSRASAARCCALDVAAAGRWRACDFLAGPPRAAGGARASCRPACPSACANQRRAAADAPPGRGRCEVRVNDDVPASPAPPSPRMPRCASRRTAGRGGVYRATPRKRGKFALRRRAPARARAAGARVRTSARVPAQPGVRCTRTCAARAGCCSRGAALDLVNLGLRQLRRDGRGTRVRAPARLRPGRLGARRRLEGHRAPRPAGDPGDGVRALAVDADLRRRGPLHGGAGGRAHQAGPRGERGALPRLRRDAQRRPGRAGASSRTA